MPRRLPLTPSPAAPAAGGFAPARPARRRADDSIRIHNAREHNLKGVDVDIPRNRFTVVTGVSGSGKSTLAFDILFAEGQRRYLESLNAYARQFVQPSARPDVDAIFGIPPTVAIEQRTSRGGRKSTVGTLTEIQHFLRLLYVKLGTQHCPDCAVPIEPQSEEAIAARILRDWRGRHIGLLAPLVVARKGVYTDLAKWALGKGFTPPARRRRLPADGQVAAPRPLPRARHRAAGGRPRRHRWQRGGIALRAGPRAGIRQGHAAGGRAARRAGESHPPGKNEAKLEQHTFSTKRACPSCGKSFAEPDPRLFSYNSKHGWCEQCYGTGLSHRRLRRGEQTGEEIWWNEWFEGRRPRLPGLRGQAPEPRRAGGALPRRSIADLSALPVDGLERFFSKLKLAGREEAIARDILVEICVRAWLPARGRPRLPGAGPRRADALRRRGAAHPAGRPARLQPAGRLLHPRRADHRPASARQPHPARHPGETAAKGNTLVVVEHDEDTIRRADHVLDLGPGAGTQGGRVVAAARPKN
jgi:excinuclease ABC subunit A